MTLRRPPGTRRTRPAACLLGLAIALALPGVAQAKVVVDSFGFEGREGGNLNRPRGIAINQTGAGGASPGTLYVADGANRIQRLGLDGAFERLWGLDVFGLNELQEVTIRFGFGQELQKTVGGEFSLTMGADLGGETIQFPLEVEGFTIKPTPAEVQSALEGLASIDPGDVRVRGGLKTFNGGGSFEIEFAGARGGTDLEEFGFNGAQIVPSPTEASIATLDDGFGGPGEGFEICTGAAECSRGITTQPAPGGQVASPGGVAVDQTTGDVYVSDAGDNRIEKFDAEGNFLRAWGWDVVQAGGTGDVSEDAFEICTVEAECKEGEQSENGGAVGFAWMALDPAGDVWVTDGVNRRFQEFEPDGSFLAAYGWDVDALGGSGELEECTSTAPGACQAATEGPELGQFKSGPADIAIDSAGFVYAIDDGFEQNRILRFDPAMTAATLFAPDLVEATCLSGSLPLFGSRLLPLPGGNLMLSGSCSGGNRLFELNAGGEVIETSLTDDGLPSVRSLALNETTGAIYATVLNTGSRPGVAVIDDGPVPAAPVLGIEPVTDITGEGATLHATVDPGGLLVADCRFEYSTDQVTWKVLPEPDCRDLDREGGPQALSETVEGLEPETQYFVRFGAGRYYNDNDPATKAKSDEVEFTTLALPPIVSDVGAARVTDTSAFLAGEINPRSQTHEYHFEYGPTEALGASTPTVEASGAQQHVVSAPVKGLEPEMTYYMRLVAENECGGPPPEPCITESPIVSFDTRPEIPTPPSRAYEQVTPPDKNFANVETGIAAADGEAAIAATGGGFGEPPGQISEIFTAYRAARTANGWRSRWHNETYCSNNQSEPIFQSPAGGSPSGYSADLDLLAILRPESSSCPHSPLDPAAPTPQTNLYRADFDSDPVGYELLAPEPGAELRLKETAGRYAGASPDWSHVLYTSNGNQTEPPDSPAPGDFAKVYDWHEGALELISKDTSPSGGSPFTTPSAVPEDALRGVSDSGNRVFFMNPTTQFGACTPAACQIYMRQNGAKTFDVSRSECTSACGEGFADQFLAATADGSKALFKSRAKLTNDDTAGNGADLYLYTHSSNPDAESNLTLLSVDEEPADGTGAQALGLLGMSEDGETAYFAAEGQLVAGEPVAAGAKLYRWRANEGSPELDYLATLGPGSQEAGNWSGAGPAGTRASVRAVTPDGEHLLVKSAARIDRGADHDSEADLYRWSEADGWLCLSCQVPTTPSAGGVALTVNDVSSHYSHAMSEDGKRAFFATSDSLSPADTNEHADLYEWREDGTLSLVSSGRDSRDVAFIGASASGRDAFFTTYERLVGWDVDDNSDVYDARIGGGFPEPAPPPPPCNPNAGECEDAGKDTSAPQTPPAATPEIVHPGNPRPDRCQTIARRAKRLNRRANRLRRAARRASNGRRASNPRRARRARRKAGRLSRKSRRVAKRARRCRTATRGNR